MKKQNPGEQKYILYTKRDIYDHRITINSFDS